MGIVDRRKVTLAGVALATTMAMAAVGSSAASGSSSSIRSSAAAPYVIGNIGTYSGLYASTSEGAQGGIEAWVKYTNAHGGINGHQVKLITKDDQGSASLALTEATELLQDHVIAFVGNESAVEGSWGPYLGTKSSVAVIGQNLATPEPYHNFFPQGTTSDPGFSWGPPKIGKLLGNDKFGAIYCAEVASCGAVADTEKQASGSAGVQFVVSESALGTATNYTAQCLQAKSAGATAIALLLAEPVANEVATSCEGQGYHPQFLQGANAFVNGEVKVPSLDGVAGFVPDFPWFASANAAEQTFQKALKQYEPQYFTSSSPYGYSESAALAWSSAEIFEAAARKLPANGTATAAEVTQALYNLPKNDTFGGLTPPISYSSKTGPQPRVKCLFVIQDKNNAWTELNGAKPLCES
jgi:branched-chain amino acid transport system substrate-binding protein